MTNPTQSRPARVHGYTLETCNRATRDYLTYIWHGLSDAGRVIAETRAALAFDTGAWPSDLGAMSIDIERMSVELAYIRKAATAAARVNPEPNPGAGPVDLRAVCEILTLSARGLWP